MTLLTKQPYKARINRDLKLDGVKGFLILCIILEHNKLLTSEYYWIRPFCDAFAAGSFLILTFVRPIKYTDISSFCDKYFSYWVPFAFFVTATSIINYFLFGVRDPTQSLGLYMKAIIFASPYEIKQSSGFMYFWFLPCLSILYIFRLIICKLNAVLLVIPFLSLLFLGDVDEQVLIRTPYSLHVIGFIYLLGTIYSKIHYMLISNSFILKLFLILLFISLSIYSYAIGWKLFLAGGIMPSWRQPGLLLYYSIFMIVAIPAIYNFMSFLPLFMINIFSFLGQQSMKIYLIHPLVFIGITKVLPLHFYPETSFLVTILLTTFIVYFISVLPAINCFIFPNRLSSLIKRENI